MYMCLCVQLNNLQNGRYNDKTICFIFRIIKLESK